MRKRVYIYEDGSQALITGDLDIRSASMDVVKAYEVDVKDKEFKEMMKEPDKVKTNKIKEKKELPVKEINKK